MYLCVVSGAGAEAATDEGFVSLYLCVYFIFRVLEACCANKLFGFLLNCFPSFSCLILFLFFSSASDG